MPSTVSATPAPDAEPIRILTSLFQARGPLAYGEAVTQEDHALQCAWLAQRAGALPALITAALLHDVGHLLHDDAATALQQGQDDGHERLGAAWLARWFEPGVHRPVALHVQAKRWLCLREPGYLEALSPVSRRTLELQGGVMDATEADRFSVQTGAVDAIRLRRWDEAGKHRGLVTPPLPHYLAIAARCLRADVAESAR